VHVNTVSTFLISWPCDMAVSQTSC